MTLFITVDSEEFKIYCHSQIALSYNRVFFFFFLCPIIGLFCFLWFCYINNLNKPNVSIVVKVNSHLQHSVSNICRTKKHFVFNFHLLLRYAESNCWILPNLTALSISSESDHFYSFIYHYFFSYLYYKLIHYNRI